jgi:hypothetical protein
MKPLFVPFYALLLVGCGDAFSPGNLAASADAHEDAGTDDARHDVAEAASAGTGGFTSEAGSDGFVEAGGAVSRQVTFRGRSSVQSEGDSVQIDAPASLASGDLLWLTLYTDLYTTQVMAPAGWILQIDRPNTTHNFRSWWFYRFAASDEPDHYVFSLNQATPSSAAIVAYSGVDPARPFDASLMVDADGSPFVVPSIATGQAGLLVVTSFTNDGALRMATTWTPDSPLASRAALDTVFVADFMQSDAGETGLRSVTCTVDGAGAVNVVALVPR